MSNFGIIFEKQKLCTLRHVNVISVEVILFRGGEYTGTVYVV